MGFVGVVVQVQLMAITGMIILSAPATANQLGLPGCETKCGDVVVPYPFGLTDGCYLDSKFHVKCINSSSPPTLILGENLLIKNISIKDHEVSITVYVGRKCYNESGMLIFHNAPWLNSPISFTISNTKNKFIVMGCDSYAYLDYENIYMGCSSKCQSIDEVPNDGSCSGIGCCQINEIPKGLKNISLEVQSYNNHTRVNNFNNCSYAFLVEDKKFKFSRQYLNNFIDDMVPLVLEWAIDNDTCLHRQNLSCPCGKNSKHEYLIDRSYNCICIPGYQGNPYLPDGCQDINECKYSYLNKCPTFTECVNTEGSYNCKPTKTKKNPQIFLKLIIAISSTSGAFLLLVVAWALYKIIKKRIDDQRKERFFKRNGGLLLQQQLSSKEVNVQTIKLFKFEELDKATDHFSVDRILGQGGQGTVYKGMLADGKIVAIKKSKLENNEEGTISESKRSEFINEVVILSQIKHRNVVNLMGCCLESEVPLLVYEFILNGTLYQYIHDNQNEEFPLTWEVRLRIASEIGSALSYLHSATSFPIYHRDIKSSNILLDEKYRAKIADFGTSRSVNIEQTHLTTQVKGTFGYLDPEYFQSSQFTEKSDVYSFGVVMVELLTGQKPISKTRSKHREESRSLATYFILCMDRNCLCDIVDSRIINDGGSQDQIIKVAHLAKRCLNLNGKHRPTMREVAMELEEIQKRSKTGVNMQSFTQHVGYEEVESLWDANSTLVCSSSFSATTSSFDALPLLKTK